MGNEGGQTRLHRQGACQVNCTEAPQLGRDEGRSFLDNGTIHGEEVDTSEQDGGALDGVLVDPPTCSKQFNCRQIAADFGHVSDGERDISNSVILLTYSVRTGIRHAYLEQQRE